MTLDPAGTVRSYYLTPTRVAQLRDQYLAQICGAATEPGPPADSPGSTTCTLSRLNDIACN